MHVTPIHWPACTQPRKCWPAQHNTLYQTVCTRASWWAASIDHGVGSACIAARTGRARGRSSCKIDQPDADSGILLAVLTDLACMLAIPVYHVVYASSRPRRAAHAGRLPDDSVTASCSR